MYRRFVGNWLGGGGGGGGVTIPQVDARIELLRRKWREFTADSNITDKTIGYLFNTDGGPITATLPAAPVVNDEYFFGRNGSELLRLVASHPIESDTDNAADIEANGFAGLLYVGGAVGWRVTARGTDGNIGIDAQFSGRVKTSNTAKISDAVMAADPHLSGYPLLANSIYLVDALIIHSSATATDITRQWSIPTGATADVAWVNSSTWDNAQDETWQASLQGNGITDRRSNIENLIVKTGANAGNLDFMWQQGVSTTDPAVIYRGSYFHVEKIG